MAAAQRERAFALATVVFVSRRRRVGLRVAMAKPELFLERVLPSAARCKLAANFLADERSHWNRTIEQASELANQWTRLLLSRVRFLSRTQTLDWRIGHTRTDEHRQQCAHTELNANWERSAAVATRIHESEFDKEAANWSADSRLDVLRVGLFFFFSFSSRFFHWASSGSGNVSESGCSHSSSIEAPWRPQRLCFALSVSCGGRSYYSSQHSPN